MAKILIEYDTKEKTLSTSMDGKSLSDICSVNIYNYKNRSGEDDAHIELVSATGNEEEGLYERHSIYASTEKKEKFTFKKKDDKKSDKKTDKKKEDEEDKEDADAALSSLAAKLGKQMRVIQVD